MDLPYPRISHKLRNAIRDLRKAKFREAEQQYLAEGPHFAQEVLRSSHTPRNVVVHTESGPDIIEMAEKFEAMGVPIYSATSKDMDLMSDASTSQGILCVLPFHTENAVADRIIVLDGVSDPGNVGTIIRCAAWFGFSDVVLGEGSADLYNPKTVRSTAGAFLRINVARKKRLSDWLTTLDDRPIIASITRGGGDPEVLSTLGRMALLIGSEAHGLTPEVQKLATDAVSIPGNDSTESLNAAVAAGILCYEGRRL